MLDREGGETGVYQYQGNVANRALELLGKHLGMFIDVHELSGPDKGPIQTQEVSPRDRLADRIAGIATARTAKDGLG